MEKGVILKICKLDMHQKSNNSLFFVTIISVILFAKPICLNADSINEKVRIKTADTELYADIKGNDRNAPILLYLHGGPANPFGILTFLAYSGPQLEEHFVVVYLQQRGIMKSAAIPDSAHTLKNYVSDTHNVVQYIKKRFINQEIYLFGHSWGGLLAYLYLLEHDGDVMKLVTACAPFSVRRIMISRYEMTLQWAKETDNKEAIKELSDINILEVSESKNVFEVMSKWSSEAYGGMMRSISRKRIDDAIDDEHLIIKWLNESKIVGDIMFETLMNIDITEKVKNLQTPLLVIAGEYDVDSPWEELKKDIENYGGEKTFLLLKNSHHLVYVDQEKQFVEAVVSFLTNKDLENFD
ncbi:MAG: alpha/beta hydrolase [bacterium]|nr:MAG: alpha/beta hydrolase [bacterium]